MYTEAVEILQRTWQQSFWNTMYTIPDPFDGLYAVEPSTQKTDTRARFGAAPMPEQWVGDREGKPLNEYTQTTTNIPYESTVTFGKETIEYLGENAGEVGRAMANQAMKARMHKAKLASALLEAGFAATCDDGQYFFDTDHAYTGAAYTTSQDNDLTSAAATGTVPTAAEAATGIRACLNAFYGFKDDQGDPLVPESYIGDPSMWIVMVPAAFGTAFRQVLIADTLSAAGDNDLKGTFTLRVNPFLTSGAVFYMFFAGSPWKPILVQQKSDVTPDSWYDQHSGTFYSSFSWWGAVDYGAWQTAIGYTYT